MSDGNTAIHVSPTEEDMSKLSSIFQRAAQAIVDSSTLPKQIEALRAEVDRLQRDLDAKSIHAQELDYALSDMRRQRDDAKHELLDTANNLVDAERALTQTQGDNNALHAKIAQLEADLSATRKERDDYGMEAMQHAEEATALKSKLEALQGHFKSLFPEPVKPEPVPESRPSTDPHVESVGFKPDNPDVPWWNKSASN